MKITFYIIFLLLFGNGFAQAPLIQWQKSFGGIGTDEGKDVIQTKDHGFLFIGNSESNDGDINADHHGAAGTLNSFGIYDIWLAKTDSIGNMQWSKSYGGSDSEIAVAVKETGDGGYIILGNTKSIDGDVSNNHGLVDLWILKIDHIGNLIWEKSFGGTNLEFAGGIVQTTDSGFVIVGSSTSIDGDLTSSYGSSDYWVLKIDQQGNLLWQKNLGGTQDDYAYSVTLNNQGEIILVGESKSMNGNVTGHHYDTNYGTNNDIWIVKLSTSGSIIWEKCFGGALEETAYSIDNCTHGGYYVAGTNIGDDCDVSGSHGNYDYWVIRISEDGDLLWQKSLGGTTSDNGYCIKTSRNNGCIVSGYSNSGDGNISNHHGAGGVLGTNDCWIVRLDSIGNIAWERSFGGSGGEYTNSLILTADNGYAFIGQAAYVNGDVTNIHGKFDYWFVKLKIDITNIEEESIASFACYPNPSNGIFTFTQPGIIKQVEVFNVFGEQILSIQNCKSIDLTEYPKGIYIAKINETYMYKILKD
jgi:hypothetical protein